MSKTAPRLLCDSNYGEASTSFSPLQCLQHGDNRVVVLNPCAPGSEDEYENVWVAAQTRSWIRRWAQDNLIHLRKESDRATLAYWNAGSVLGSAEWHAAEEAQKAYHEASAMAREASRRYQSA